MKTIQLHSKKYPGYEAIVDDEDYEELIKYEWHPQFGTHHNTNTIYATRSIKKQKILMHRIIIQIHNYNIETKLIDHEDHKGLNNQKENLRICSYSQNGQNQNNQNRSLTSIYKGVYFKKDRNKFRVCIKLNGKPIHVGYFIDEQEAALAYNKKATELFGEFCCLNIISV